MKKKIAVVDPMFTWPPHGGACVDLRETFTRLAKKGLDVKLFVPEHTSFWHHGDVDDGRLDFPVERVPFTGLTYNRVFLPKKMRAAVGRYDPDYVFIGDSAFYKPVLVHAFKDFKVILRFYTYDILCFRSFSLFKNGQRCPNNFLATPSLCLECGLEQMKTRLAVFHLDLLTQEFLGSGAFLPSFHRYAVSALKRCHAVIVYNRMTKDLISDFNANVHVVPGGVDADVFTPGSRHPKNPGGPVKVLMAGRVNDERKGFALLREANRHLARTGLDYRIQYTSNTEVDNPNMEALGWLSHEGMMNAYRNSDICVFPSLWEEPFGIVALEAMACGKPAVVTAVGGLKEIVQHGSSGMVVNPGDARGLALALGALIEDAELREEMGAAARARVLENFTWDAVVSKHYGDIFP